MINSVYILEGKNGSFNELHKLITIISDRTAFQVGCISSQVWVNDQRAQVILMESWKTLDDLILHINSKIYRRLLSAMEMGASKPEVKFYECNNIRGMDFIEEVLLYDNGIEQKKEIVNKKL